MIAHFRRKSVPKRLPFSEGGAWPLHHVTCRFQPDRLLDVSLGASAGLARLLQPFQQHMRRRAAKT